jgi:hypothetical protein
VNFARLARSPRGGRKDPAEWLDDVVIFADYFQESWWYGFWLDAHGLKA